MKFVIACKGGLEKTVTLPELIQYAKPQYSIEPTLRDVSTVLALVIEETFGLNVGGPRKIVPFLNHVFCETGSHYVVLREAQELSKPASDPEKPWRPFDALSGTDKADVVKQERAEPNELDVLRRQLWQKQGDKWWGKLIRRNEADESFTTTPLGDKVADATAFQWGVAREDDPSLDTLTARVLAAANGTEQTYDRVRSEIATYVLSRYGSPRLAPLPVNDAASIPEKLTIRKPGWYRLRDGREAMVTDYTHTPETGSRWRGVVYEQGEAWKTCWLNDGTNESKLEWSLVAWIRDLLENQKREIPDDDLRSAGDMIDPEWHAEVSSNAPPATMPRDILPDTWMTRDGVSVKAGTLVHHPDCKGPGEVGGDGVARCPEWVTQDGVKRRPLWVADATRCYFTPVRDCYASRQNIPTPTTLPSDRDPPTNADVRYTCAACGKPMNTPADGETYFCDNSSCPAKADREEAEAAEERMVEDAEREVAIAGMQHAYEKENPDHDLDLFNRHDLRTVARAMRQMIRKVVTAKGDDLCWRDVYTYLAGLLPEKPAVDFTPPTDVFLGNCKRFEESMRRGTLYVSDDRNKNLFDAIDYALGAFYAAAKTGRCSLGGEQSGNWEDVASAYAKLKNAYEAIRNGPLLVIQPDNDSRLPIGTRVVIPPDAASRGSPRVLSNYNNDDKTASLIASFAGALYDKMNEAEKKHGWKDDWLETDRGDWLRADLVTHLHKGDPLDVALYCAFLWFHKLRTTPIPDVRVSPPKDAWIDAVVDAVVKEMVPEHEYPEITAESYREKSREHMRAFYTHGLPLTMIAGE